MANHESATVANPSRVVISPFSAEESPGEDPDRHRDDRRERDPASVIPLLIADGDQRRDHHSEPDGCDHGSDDVDEPPEVHS